MMNRMATALVTMRGWLDCVRWLFSALLAMWLLSALPEASAADARLWTHGAVALPALETLDGRRFDPASLAGKTVVLNFWAVWCAPCREELPAIDRLAAALKGKPIEVLLVNVGDSSTAIDKLFAKQATGLRSLRLAAGEMPGEAWRFSALPATVIVDARALPRWVVRGSLDAQAEPVRGLLARLIGAT